MADSKGFEVYVEDDTPGASQVGWWIVEDTNDAYLAARDVLDKCIHDGDRQRLTVRVRPLAERDAEMDKIRRSRSSASSGERPKSTQ